MHTSTSGLVYEKIGLILKKEYQKYKTKLLIPP